jgi:pyruvate/2-oxoglutarate dehydrogenase complex dihydrolipoamide dehydrogenase (E3) component
MQTADVIVIGSGQAGVPLATRLAAAGKRVVIAERGDFGGTCVNVGCTPTKTMIASARAAHVARGAGRLVDRKDGIVKRWRDGVARRLNGAGENLTVVRGHAKFAGAQEVEINGARYSAKSIVINVGGRPVAPPLEGLESVPWLDNARAMQLREVPRHLVVLGGGYIGCELGQMFRRFGARVTMVDRNDHLLSREDADISAALEAAFRSEGIELELNATVARVSKEGAEIAVQLGDGKSIRGTHLLVAVGRRPNTDDLGCDAAGIKLDKNGFVIVDDEYRTSADGVYAVGDCDGGPQFTHTAWDDHRLLFDALMGRPHHGRLGRVIPYAVFTDPQVSGVGSSERDAKARGLEYEVATMPFGNIARAIELDETAGLMKVLIDPKTSRVLGAAIVGAEAGELIHIFVTLMQSGASARAIVEAEAVHPTFAEGVQSLVMKLDRFALR